jgi:hypothetical protein
MGLCISGLDAKLTPTTVQIHVTEDHPYIRLANALDWSALTELIIADIKLTEKRRWWVGRKLYLRIHLGVFILQTFVKLTDRGMEDAIKSNGVYQIFCGKSIVDSWHCPDHTKIEKFRNRLSPQTQQQLVSYIVKTSSVLGFADPSKMDVDSTVQEAGMAYPADANLLTKLAYKCKKIIAPIANACQTAKSLIDVDIKSIKKTAKDYFFMAKNKFKTIRCKAFEKLYNIVKQEITPIIEHCMQMTTEQVKDLPWNIRQTVEQIRNHALKYLTDVAYFMKNHTMKTGKILSFHLMDVACIIKGKVGKDKEFGRVYQLGRIGGNFLLVLPSTSVRQNDKSSLIPMVQEHQAIFGKNTLKSLGADKGYFTKNNVEILGKEIEQLAIQAPGNVKSQCYIPQELKDRRAGIEPLIGHAKKFGLGKSNAKSDRTILASGYRSILGFNLHQLTRYLSGKVKTKMV